MTRSSSTKPKGATSFRETALGIIPRSKLLLLELKGTRRGLDMVAKLRNSEINPDLIIQVHKESFGWIFPDWAGKYRTIRVEFSGKEAVPSHQIPELITNLCSDLNERLQHINPKGYNYVNEVVELLAWFQHRFVWIHPFQDYNGRISRMFTVLILLSLNLPPIEIKVDRKTDRKKYLEAMYSADNGNYSKLEKLIGSALNESLTKSIKKT